MDAAFPGKFEHRMFGARMIPFVVRPVEFGEPQTVFVFDDRFGARAAH